MCIWKSVHVHKCGPISLYLLVTTARRNTPICSKTYQASFLVTLIFSYNLEEENPFGKTSFWFDLLVPLVLVLGHLLCINLLGSSIKEIVLCSKTYPQKKICKGICPHLSSHLFSIWRAVATMHVLFWVCRWCRGGRVASKITRGAFLSQVWPREHWSLLHGVWDRDNFSLLSGEKRHTYPTIMFVSEYLEYCFLKKRVSWILSTRIQSISDDWRLLAMPRS